MKMRPLGVCLLAAALAGVPARAQNWQQDGASEQRPKPPIPAAGFWPTPRMMELAIDRMTEEMAHIYGFDEDQLWNTRDLLKARFPAWLERNRGEIQTLFNQYFEALLAGTPPTPEEVARWAERALPLFEEFTGLVEQTTEDMRQYLTDEQQVLLDGQIAAMRVGTNYMLQRLNTWKEGGYDWETEWPRSPEFKRTERDRRHRLDREAQRASEAAMGITPDATTAVTAGTESGVVRAAEASRPAATRPARTGPKDEWTIYVENFIQRYQLDAAQQNSARKALASAQEQRDRYLRRKVDEINAVEAKSKAAQTDDERAKVKAELEQLNRPIERYFQQLKERLDRIPTRKQRMAAAQADQTAREQAEVSEKTKASLKAEMEARARQARPDGGEEAEQVNGKPKPG